MILLAAKIRETSADGEFMDVRNALFPVWGLIVKMSMLDFVIPQALKFTTSVVLKESSLIELI